jgi:hypothetical protein
MSTIIINNGLNSASYTVTMQNFSQISGYDSFLANNALPLSVTLLFQKLVNSAVADLAVGEGILTSPDSLAATVSIGPTGKITDLVWPGPWTVSNLISTIEYVFTITLNNDITYIPQSVPQLSTSFFVPFKFNPSASITVTP